MIRINSLLLGLEIWGAIFALLIFALEIRENNKTEEIKVFSAMQITCFLYIVSDVLSWAVQGQTARIFVYVEYISTFLFYLCGYLLLALYTRMLFLGVEVSRQAGTIQYGVYGLMALSIILLIVSQFNHMFYYIDAGNYYYRGYAYSLSQIPAFLGILMDGCFLLRFKEQIVPYKRIGMAAYIVVPLICLILQDFFYGLSFICIGMLISNIIMYRLFQRQLRRERIANQEEIIRQKEILFDQEKAIHDMQYRIVLSQIQPHFLYNALNAIYYLCETDPMKAQTSIADFSEYLRGNMKSLQSDQTIPLNEELRHVKHYLSLEKLRFDEDIEIFWDIREQNFMVPPLSIQPIVENAVKHGLGKKEGGGYVRISTDRDEDYFRIMVMDNGVGFDPAEYIKDGKLHIGLENVRTRLRQMTGGKMILESEPGSGTRVTLLIPVREIELQKRNL